MNLIFIDYLANKKNTFLHRLTAVQKLVGLLFVFLVILFSPSWEYPFIVYIALLLLIFSVKFPLQKIFPLTLYPLVFTVILLLSYQDLTIPLLLHFVFRVLLASTSVILFLITTPFPEVFSFLSKFTPTVIVSAFFLTYRSIFILNTVFSDLQTGLYLRGGLQAKNPFRKLQNIGVILGQVFILALEKSERLSASLYVRGWRGKIYG